MHGYLNEDANLALFAQRQASLESAAEHSRLVRALKRARRCAGEQPSTHAQARSGPSCPWDRG